MDLPESIHESMLIIIELGILSGSLGVVLLANVVYSAFSLGPVSICISLFYLVLNADSVAAAQSLIYVGAINVLIVFAVMVTDKPMGRDSPTLRNVGDAITSGACTGLFSLLTFMIRGTEWSNIFLIEQSGTIAEDILRNNIQQIGYQFLTNFIVSFELLSILLLVASVGAITTARDERIDEIDEGVTSTSRDESSFY
uniref:NADH-plastoquinone oxidoreductase subunit 4L n=1 Tax=Diplopterygium chinense TaxID=397680 RepID=UPI0020292C1C|nr:NADH-plastoquinone oxidoreductase subunit 4L [Diplopterygium chinense]QYC93015.1 NADH-plastoquinone oxidoreductase subunit 4L [Diplopterygium chinense]